MGMVLNLTTCLQLKESAIVTVKLLGREVDLRVEKALWFSGYSEPREREGGDRGRDSEGRRERGGGRERGGKGRERGVGGREKGVRDGGERN